jgi:ATP-dependent DNA helicase RecG
MIDLTLEQSAHRIAQLLTAHESRTLDFKRIGVKQARKLEAVCAFANSEGGLLVIGIGDEKALKPGAKPESRLFGIEENAEAFDDFRRELVKSFAPPITKLHWMRLACTLQDGKPGHIVLLRVEKSDQVHSIIGDGTWTRMDASNRELNASEIAELSYRRGVRSAASELVPVKLSLLETDMWRLFATARGLRAGTFAEQLQRIGLADELNGEMHPTRAAVLLFAGEPGGLLAAYDTRADIRLMIYEGKAVVHGATPNFRKAVRTIRGPLIEQIDIAKTAVLFALAQGITLANSGFETRHLYPERVVTEAIVNAVIHRDYRLNRDIFIRIFDDRIEIESPGVFPGSITPGNISKAGSKARNPLIAQNLREFPVAPNIDAGEGVKMMFAEMAAAQLYPPQYSQNTDSEVESVTVTLLNHERPTAWDEVSHWIDTNGEIANSDLRDIAKIDTLEASRMLKAWVEQGVLVQMPNRAKRNMAYVKPQQSPEQGSLLSEVLDNKSDIEK